MINYETNSSPFYTANKNYCEAIESKLKQNNAVSSGYCNSFGYLIESAFQKNKLTYKLKIYKQQTTQNGVVVPVDSRDYAGTEITISGFNTGLKISIGKSSLNRFFSSKAYSHYLPAPYFIKFKSSPDEKNAENLFSIIKNYSISTFKLASGTLFCKVQKEISDPIFFLEEIETLLKNLA